MLNPVTPLEELRKDLLDRAFRIIDESKSPFMVADTWLRDYRLLLQREQDEMAVEVAKKLNAKHGA